MNTYTDDELSAMSVDSESDLVERKRKMTAKIGKNICAFANDLPGHGKPGVVFVGVEDDGRCAGLCIDDRLLQDLASLRDNGRLQPLPSMDVQRRTLNGCEVAVVIVHPACYPPVRHDGRVWVRVGPTLRQASASDEQRLAERRRAMDIPFDMRPAHGAALSDLHLGYIEREYLPRAVAEDVLARNRRTLGEQLRSLRLAVGGSPAGFPGEPPDRCCPTNGALLAFARDPRRWLPDAYVQYVRFDGDDRAAPVKSSKVLAGRIDDVLGSLNQLMELSIAVRIDATAGPREVRLPDYPAEALRELAYNAVMHRNYDGAHTPSRVNWFSGRVEIESPGGLFGSVTPENLKRGATSYRNRLIAEIMGSLGFAQRFGSGIPRARQALNVNGNPEPEFEFEDSRVMVTVRTAR